MSKTEFDYNFLSCQWLIITENLNFVIDIYKLFINKNVFLMEIIRDLK